MAENFGEEIGYVDFGGDRDAFEVEIAGESELTIAATSTDGFLDTFLRVYNEDGELIAENDDFGDSLDSQVSIDVGTGTYYFTVGSFEDSGEGEFVTTVEANPIDVDGAAGDLGDGLFDDAIWLDVADSGRAKELGSIDQPGDEVVFVYEAVADGDLIIRSRDVRSGLDTTLTVYDSDGNEIAFNDDFRFWTDSRVRIDGVEGETYFIVVAGYGESTGDFNLRVGQRQTGFRLATAGSDFAATRSVDQVFAGRGNAFLA